MATIFQKNGFSVRIYSNDHDPAHVHVFKADGEAKINLCGEDGEVEWDYVKRMSDKDAIKALQLVSDNQEMLLRKWQEYHGQQTKQPRATE